MQIKCLVLQYFTRMSHPIWLISADASHYEPMMQSMWNSETIWVNMEKPTRPYSHQTPSFGIDSNKIQIAHLVIHIYSRQPPHTLTSSVPMNQRFSLSANNINNTHLFSSHLNSTDILGRYGSPSKRCWLTVRSFAQPLASKDLANARLCTNQEAMSFTEQGIRSIWE